MGEGLEKLKDGHDVRVGCAAPVILNGVGQALAVAGAAGGIGNDDDVSLFGEDGGVPARAPCVFPRGLGAAVDEEGDGVFFVGVEERRPHAEDMDVAVGVVGLDGAVGDLGWVEVEAGAVLGEGGEGLDGRLERGVDGGAEGCFPVRVGRGRCSWGQCRRRRGVEIPPYATINEAGARSEDVTVGEGDQTGHGAGDGVEHGLVDDGGVGVDVEDLFGAVVFSDHPKRVATVIPDDAAGAAVPPLLGERRGAVLGEPCGAVDVAHDEDFVPVGLVAVFTHGKKDDLGAVVREAGRRHRASKGAHVDSIDGGRRFKVVGEMNDVDITFGVQCWAEVGVFANKDETGGANVEVIGAAERGHR